MKTLPTTALLAAALLTAGAAAAAPLDGIGRSLSRAARDAGFSRVALGRLEPAAGASAAIEAELKEGLLASLLRDGSVTVLERAAVPELMAERALRRSGAMEAPAEPDPRLAAAQAVVLGRYYPTRQGTRVAARLVAVDSGVILAAAEAVLEDASFPAPAFAASPERPRPLPMGFGLGDASSADPLTGCLDASEKVARLQESVLDLKARYWARRAALDRPALDATRDPESGIPDPQLRQAFRERVEYWRKHRRVPPLSADEVKRFIDADGEAFALRLECRS